MAISDWFAARESRRYTPATQNRTADVPDGVWVKCDECKRTLYEGQLAEALRVCPSCGHHFPLGALERIAMFADEDTFQECDAGLHACDPLGFVAAKPYTESLDAARAKSGLPEAVVIGTCRIDGQEVAIGAMDFRFIGASMGSVVGEKVARLFELALTRRLPVVFAAASGGARMQEGMLSLMQMAATAAAVRRHADAGLVYISVLTNPTYGGVSASFATLADVVLAEPGARIGFAGPNVIEQTIRQKLPKGFQTAESLVRHGMVDAVVPRGELRGRVSLLLGYLTSCGEARG